MLESCSHNVYELLDVNKLLPHLCEENLLNEDERRLFKRSEIEPEHTRERKITKLLNVLPKQGPDGLRRFVKCLKSSQTGTDQELAAIIEDQFSVSDTSGSTNESITGILYLSHHKVCTQPKMKAYGHPGNLHLHFWPRADFMV